jgi:hypothetical protein
MRTKSVKIPIYLGTIVLIETDDFKLLETKYGIQFDNPEDCVVNVGAAVWSQPTKHGVVRYIGAFHPNVQNFDIAHESVHLANLIFRERGIKPDPYNDEPQAYLTGWLFDQIERFLNKTKNQN